MKKSVRMRISLLLAGVMLATAACGGGGNSTASGGEMGNNEIILKLGHAMSDDHSWNVAAQKFSDLVEERSEGTIKVELYPNSSLGGDRDLFEGMQMGNVDMALIAGVIGNFYEPIQLLELPYIFNSQEHLEKVIYGDVGSEVLAEILEQTGVRGLEWWERTPRELTANKAVNTPQDLKGMKIRVPEITASIDGWKAMGANPTPMAQSEVYTALQQKTIDGQENPLANAAAVNIQEVNKYCMLTDHVYGYVLHLVSDKTWNKLTPEQQQIITDCAKEAREYQNTLIYDEEAKIRKEWEEEGVTFIEVNKEDFAELAKSVHAEYAEQYGQELYDKIVAADAE